MKARQFDDFRGLLAVTLDVDDDDALPRYPGDGSGSRRSTGRWSAAWGLGGDW
jgi:hypothetical protein